MLRVEVTCMDALDFIKQRDHAQALFYIDPPYLQETRVGQGGEYSHEWTEAQHRDLLNLLVGIKGKFILSGYNSAMYSSYACQYDWRTDYKLVDKPSSRSDIKPLAYEYLWMNF
jgi:DNA adenine methylase